MSTPVEYMFPTLDTSQAAVFSSGEDRIVVMASATKIMDTDAPDAAIGQVFVSNNGGGSWKDCYLVGFTAHAIEKTFNIEFADARGSKPRSFFLFGEKGEINLLEVGSEDKIAYERGESIATIEAAAIDFMTPDELIQLEAFLENEEESTIAIMG